MGNSQRPKDVVLGMPFGTANARLRKDLLFYLAGLAGMLNCFRCSKPIDSIEQFSIEHKEPWEKSTEPVRLFFSIDNIAFSHFRCNVGAASRVKKHLNKKEGQKAWAADHPFRDRGKNRSVVKAKLSGPKLQFD